MLCSRGLANVLGKWLNSHRLGKIHPEPVFPHTNYPSSQSLQIKNIHFDRLQGNECINPILSYASTLPSWGGQNGESCSDLACPLRDEKKTTVESRTENAKTVQQTTRASGQPDAQGHWLLDRWHEEIHHLLPLFFALFLIITSEVSQLTLKVFCIVLLILCGKQVYTIKSEGSSVSSGWQSQMPSALQACSDFRWMKVAIAMVPQSRPFLWLR